MTKMLIESVCSKEGCLNESLSNNVRIMRINNENTQESLIIEEKYVF